MFRSTQRIIKDITVNHGRASRTVNEKIEALQRERNEDKKTIRSLREDVDRLQKLLRFYSRVDFKKFMLQPGATSHLVHSIQVGDTKVELRPGNEYELETTKISKD